MPSPSSQKNSGVAESCWTAPPGSMRPRTPPDPEATRKEPPTRPSTANRRGTSPVRYIMKPRIRPFPTPTTNWGPRLKVHCCMARNASPTALKPAPEAASAAAQSCRRVTTAHTHRVPPLDDPVQGGRGADVGDDEDGLGEGSPQHARVLPGAGDVVALKERRVEGDLGDDGRDVGEHEQPADDRRGSSHRVALGLSRPGADALGHGGPLSLPGVAGRVLRTGFVSRFGLG